MSELDFVAPDTPIDLTNCDREPIHIPGAIQPYGVLLALDESTLVVRMASESTKWILGQSPETVLGAPLAALLGDDAVARVRSLVGADERRRSGRVRDERGRAFDATVHHSGGLLILELEPEAELEDEELSAERMTATMRRSIARLDRAESLAEVANGIAQEMREITGFDRVWVYRFHPDWHGEIIGEARREDIETWLGMHYPASDIPAQARALFLKNWLRVIPDIAFIPSPLHPPLNPRDGAPLDLGNSVLRSVSPIHIQYLTNMGVTASLVLSLVHRGTLWGLISGHHYSGPKRVSAATRVMCEFLAQALSLQVGVTDRLATREHALEIRRRQGRLLERLGGSVDFPRVLTAEGGLLTNLAEADGAAIVQSRDIARIGSAPDDEQLRLLVAWLKRLPHRVVVIDALSRHFPPAVEYRALASGLLALPLSRDRTQWLLWFRRERRQTVRWAGDPRKPVIIGADGETRLHPRGSFEAWEEEVRGTAVPWEPFVIEAVDELRRGIVDLLLRQAEETAQLNEELMASNAQLEETAVMLEEQAQELMNQRELREQLLSQAREARVQAESANRAKADFLAVMSHELRTPLNAIGGYAELISLGVRGPTTEAQLSDLERIQFNQRHLLGLINSILNFTKLEAGTVQFHMTSVALAPLVGGMEALVAPQMRQKSIHFLVNDCPTDVVVHADESKLRQILVNLLSNALKFTPSGGTVELRCRASTSAVEIDVQDSGIGIPAQSLEHVFEPFVQIDRAVGERSDQGVGLGLAISRELARAMDGELSVTSEVGRGSTFTLRLPLAS